MKKPPEDQPLRQRRILRNRLRRIRSKPVSHREAIRTNVLARILNRTAIAAPETISFYPEHADETVRFVHAIGDSCTTGTKALLNFSNTDVITAMGAVYLFSELHRLSSERGVKVVTIDANSANKHVRGVLRQSGLLALANGQPQPTGGLLPITFGKDDDYLEDILSYLINSAVLHQQLGMANRVEAEKLAGEAIKEAMLNVKYHAYPDETDRIWWITAAIFGGELHIALCDRGVGIPETLPRTSWYEHLRSISSLDDDAKMIQAAMEYTRTSHMTKHGRGLGTRDIQNLVLDRKMDHLTIVSGKGHYRLSGIDSRETTTKIDYNVSGTVIQWSIPLTEPTEDYEYE